MARPPAPGGTLVRMARVWSRWSVPGTCLALCLLVPAGCVRAGFGEASAGAKSDLSDLGHDGPAARDSRQEQPADTGAADGPPCSWGSWSAPSPVTELNSGGDDWAPFIAADGLELYFSRWVSGAETDIFVATRSDATGQFGTPAPLSQLNSPTADNAPVLSSDGLVLYFGSNRPGGAGNYDIYRSARPSISDPFVSPTLVTSLSTAESEHLCSLSRDGLVLYFRRYSNATSSHDIFAASRSGPGDPFGAAVAVTEINSTANERAATISPDGLELYVSSARPGGSGAYDIWVARRSTVSDDFGAPKNVTVFNTALDDYVHSLSADGSRIYLGVGTTLAGGGPADADISVATRSCTP